MPDYTLIPREPCREEVISCPYPNPPRREEMYPRSNSRYEEPQAYSCPAPRCDEPQMHAYPQREEALACPYPNPCRKPYTMAYVQPQCWETVMCAGDALAHGTAFPSLVKPFLGKEACKR